MFKLGAQLVVVAAVWSITTYAQIAPIWQLVSLVAALVGVHFAGNALFSAGDYHGIYPVGNDDPMIRSAMEEARQTFPKFEAIYPKHRQDSIVRFQFVTDTGTAENLWGDLLELTEDKAKVFVRTPPATQNGPMDRTMTIDRDAITDWLVELPDGSIRGGYTTRAIFKVQEREMGRIPAEAMRQLSRFKDIDW